jgi:hypothetical protein
MMSMLVFYTLTFPITIDRVEDNLTVIEWQDGTFDTIPTYLFPHTVYEGQSWYLHLQKKRNQITSSSELGLIVNEYPAYIHQYNAIISLPHPTALPLGEVYTLHFSPLRGTYVQ